MNYYFKETNIEVIQKLQFNPIGRNNMLLVLCFVFLLKETSTFDIFVAENSTSCLICPVTDAIKDVTWLGPPNEMIYINGYQVDVKYTAIFINSSTGQSVLCIDSVTDDYLGIYKCFGSNFKKTTSFNVTIIKMVIEDQQLNGSIAINETEERVLKCSIDPIGPVEVLQWTTTKETLVSNKTEEICLPLKPTTADNGNVYTCQAIDGNGKVVVKKKVTIKVYGRPVTPTLLGSMVMSNTVTIKWNPLYDGGYPPQSFVVQYQKYRDNSRDEVNNTWFDMHKTNQNHLVLHNLLPETHYFVRMYACNQIKCSEHSPAIMVTTGHSRPLKDEDSDIDKSGYYALVVLPVVLVIVVVVYFTRGNRFPISIKRFWASQDEDQEQNVVDVGPGAVGNDLYGQANIRPPSRQNDEVQVYSSFDRRHNITLSTHAQSASYDVRPKQKPNNGRNKKKAAKEKRPTNDTRQIEESQNAQQLNYVEVSFDTKRSGNRVKIHGKKQPSTDYVDIDFTKKFIAPPVQANHADSDDDFESEYEIKKMKRRTKLQEK